MKPAILSTSDWQKEDGMVVYSNGRLTGAWGQMGNGEVQGINCGPGKTCMNMKKYWRDDRHNIRGSSGKYTAVICTNL